MSMEQNILDKLSGRINESVTYNDNGQIASDLAKGMGGFSFDAIITLVSPSMKGIDNAGIIMPIKFDINEDDIEVVESDNVVYVYLRTDKIDYEIKWDGKLEYISPMNLDLMIKNRKSFLKVNPKCWRDDNKLYLLKMNRNSGIIGRFDRDTSTFRNQQINYKSSIDVEIGADLLTKDYLEDYLGNELIKLFTSIDPKYEFNVESKLKNEAVVKFESVR